jgi:hypothetical protein
MFFYFSCSNFIGCPEFISQCQDKSRDMGMEGLAREMPLGLNLLWQAGSR